MITAPSFGTFADAYLAVLHALVTDPEHRITTRGTAAIEITNVSFTLADPIQRTPHLAARRSNIIFNHAETLWYLSGRRDLDMIAHYAPSLRALSADGLTLTGTAYGPALFTPGESDSSSPFDRVLHLLRTDPDSKRAVVPIMRPGELIAPANPDVSCTLGLQFLRRAGRLVLIAYLRANDVMIGLLGDVFAFTFIQEFTARLLGLPVGRYGHHIGSLHLNGPHQAKAQAILAAPERWDFPAARMPVTTSWADIETVLIWEERLRTDQAQFTPDSIDVGDYWTQIIALFEVHRQLRSDPEKPIGDDTLTWLRPGHRWLIGQRWPDRLPASAQP
jgi:thymidylate synthase